MYIVWYRLHVFIFPRTYLRQFSVFFCDSQLPTPTQVIDRTFKVLSTNAARETFGNPDEEELSTDAGNIRLIWIQGSFIKKLSKNAEEKLGT